MLMHQNCMFMALYFQDTVSTYCISMYNRNKSVNKTSTYNLIQSVNKFSNYFRSNKDLTSQLNSDLCTHRSMWLFFSLHKSFQMRLLLTTKTFIIKPFTSIVICFVCYGQSLQPYYEIDSPG